MRTSVIVIATVMLLVLWGWWGDYSPSIASHWIGSYNDNAIERAGNWGDSFGAFNALISALGSALILATIALQARALREQRVDLHKQRFESSFFELLRLMRELRNEISFHHSQSYLDKNKQTPSIFFQQTKITTEREYDRGVKPVPSALLELSFWLKEEGITFPPSKDQLASIYDKRIHKPAEATISPYFRLVYTILDRIRADRVLEHDEKVRYANLVRSQLTSHDLTLMAVNALSEVANDFATLISMFHMLKYMPQSTWRRRMQAIYPENAFKARES